MRRFITILILVAAVSTVISSCGTFRPDYAKATGLEITVTGEGSNTNLKLVTANSEYNIGAGSAYWLYDVEDDQLEYLLIEYAPLGEEAGRIRSIEIHQHKSDKPAE